MPSKSSKKLPGKHSEGSCWCFCKGAKEAIVTNHISSHLWVLGPGIKISLHFVGCLFFFFFAETKKAEQLGELFEEQKKMVLFLGFLGLVPEALLLNCYRCVVYICHFKTCQSAGLKCAKIVAFMSFLWPLKVTLSLKWPLALTET